MEGRVHAVGLPELFGAVGQAAGRKICGAAVRSGGRGVQRGSRRLHLRHPKFRYWLGGLDEPATGSHRAAQGPHRAYCGEAADARDVHLRRARLDGSAKRRGLCGPMPRRWRCAACCRAAATTSSSTSPSCSKARIERSRPRAPIAWPSGIRRRPARRRPARPSGQ